jgi:isocitrate/isopropylmalate dehydrogenase
MCLKWNDTKNDGGDKSREDLQDRPDSGDGIGKEVVPAGARCWRRWRAQSRPSASSSRDFDWGGDYYRAHGVMMPDDGLDALRDKDAILFGSAGDPHIPTTSRCGACA